MSSEQDRRLEFGLTQRVKAIDNTRPYEIFVVMVAGVYREVKYNLQERGHIHLLCKTEEEILGWVQRMKG